VAFYTDKDIRWFSPSGDSPDWSDSRQKCLACLIYGQEGTDLYLMFNANTEEMTFVLPPPGRGQWHRAVDTALSSPGDFCAPGEEIVLGSAKSYVLEPQSSAVLVAR
jgi:glycogen operon protein